MSSDADAGGRTSREKEEEKDDHQDGGRVGLSEAAVRNINLASFLASSSPSSAAIAHHHHPQHQDESFDSHMTNASSVASSSVSSATNQSSIMSMALNPNSTLDNEDMAGIALLKEIFPEDSTDALRDLHHQHILAHKSQTALLVQSQTRRQSRSQQQQQQQYHKFGAHSPIPEAASSGSTRSDDGREALTTTTTTTPRHSIDDNNNSTLPSRCPLLDTIPLVELPEDFLRLPTSVAVLRTHDVVVQADNVTATRRYEFLADLQQRMLHEYKLSGNDSSFSWDSERIRYEFITVSVQRDARWGLGMTLQEEEEEVVVPPRTAALQPQQSTTATRYGLKVVGFLPDPHKVATGQISSDITTSPAQEAGIHLNDILIGINGEAFLLPSLSYSMSSQQLGRHYKNQKARIVSSIQQSPNPVVVHVKRLQIPSSVTKGDRRTSLLDATMQEFDDTPSFAQQSSHSNSKILTPRSTSTPILSPFDPKPQIPQFRPSTTIHPLAEALMQRKLIQSRDDQWRITFRLQHFTERTRQWEASNTLRLHSKSLALIPYFDPKDLPPDMASLMVFPSGDEEEKKRYASTDLDSDSQSNGVHSFDGVPEDGTGSSGAFWGAKCSPSTPTLPLDSPVIPVEYLQAVYGDEKAAAIRSRSVSGNGRQSVTPNRTATIEQSPAVRRHFQPRQSWDPFQNANTPEFPAAWKRSTNTVSEQDRQHVVVPLYGIRKSLSARIVNSFAEVGPDSNNAVPARMAYTMWVYDVESGREWYAPIRYWKDFCDLRDAAMGLLQSSSNLHKELSSIKFPKEVMISRESGIWDSAVFSRASRLSPLQDRRRKRQIEEFEEAREQSARVLEEFVMELLGAIYTCVPLHPNVAEIALYVQSFLGVDAGLAEEAVVFQESKLGRAASDLEQEECRKRLKRSIQRYTWRIFLLHTMKSIVQDFVDAARSRGPKLQDIESLEAQGRSVIKARAMDELSRIQNFLDHLVDLVLDGCGDDLRMIAGRHNFSRIQNHFADETYWDCLVRESVREQVEIEVYVPLRGLVSRLLVNGWRHEDMEVQFKIKELSKRSQSSFRIPEANTSPSSWQSVASILRQGVGMSTLPCVKLRAIVAAAREISRLHQREHGEGQMLGADDFLPIFIFSVVQAEMERPCALCVLLQTLCDRTNRIGEIGYFLASFEAAVTHVQEIDLTEDRDEISFLSAHLTEVSLSD